MHKVNVKAFLPGHREHNYLLIQTFLHSIGVLTRPRRYKLANSGMRSGPTEDMCAINRASACCYPACRKQCLNTAPSLAIVAAVAGSPALCAPQQAASRLPTVQPRSTFTHGQRTRVHPKHMRTQPILHTHAHERVRPSKASADRDVPTGLSVSVFNKFELPKIVSGQRLPPTLLPIKRRLGDGQGRSARKTEN
jgi:hypothetical protein